MLRYARLVTALVTTFAVTPSHATSFAEPEMDALADAHLHDYMLMGPGRSYVLPSYTRAWLSQLVSYVLPVTPDRSNYSCLLRQWHEDAGATMAVSMACDPVQRVAFEAATPDDTLTQRGPGLWQTDPDHVTATVVSLFAPFISPDDTYPNCAILAEPNTRTAGDSDLVQWSMTFRLRCPPRAANASPPQVAADPSPPQQALPPPAPDWIPRLQSVLRTTTRLP